MVRSKLGLCLFLMTVMLFLSPYFIHVAGASLETLAPDIQGYNEEFWETGNNLTDFNSWCNYVLNHYGVYNAKSYLTDCYCTNNCGYNNPVIIESQKCPNTPTPDKFLVVTYTNASTNRKVWMEIYYYSGIGVASSAYGSQAYGSIIDDQTFGGSIYGGIFQRFQAQDVLLYRSNYMIFLICPTSTSQESADTLATSTLTDFTQKYIDYLFNLIPESTQPPQPPTVNAPTVWGVKPGDIISWQAERTTVTGQAEPSDMKTEKTIEIIQKTSDNSAILLKEPQSPSDFAYDIYQMNGISNFILPKYEFSWANNSVGDPNIPFPLIYPTSSHGKTLKDMIISQDYDVTESAEYIRGHYATAPGEGYTPVQTQWKDITVHKGTGITTSGSSYLNDNEYSITSTTDLTLNWTNFDLSTRGANNNIPLANFTANTTSGTAPLTVQFTDTSTGSPTSWNWSFGDGKFSTLQNPVHTYASNGLFTVTLTATNAKGSDIITKTNSITVGSGSPVQRYDTNGTPGIQKAELINALNDFLTYHTLPKADLITVLNAFLFP